MCPDSTLNIAKPQTIQMRDMIRPLGEIGTLSPYPTVVTVTAAHQIASSIPSKYPGGKWVGLLVFSTYHIRCAKMQIQMKMKHKKLMKKGSMKTL